MKEKKTPLPSFPGGFRENVPPAIGKADLARTQSFAWGGQLRFAHFGRPFHMLLSAPKAEERW